MCCVGTTITTWLNVSPGMKERKLRVKIKMIINLCKSNKTRSSISFWIWTLHLNNNVLLNAAVVAAVAAALCKVEAKHDITKMRNIVAAAVAAVQRKRKIVIWVLWWPMMMIMVAKMSNFNQHQGLLINLRNKELKILQQSASNNSIEQTSIWRHITTTVKKKSISKVTCSSATTWTSLLKMRRTKSSSATISLSAVSMHRCSSCARWCSTCHNKLKPLSTITRAMSLVALRLSLALNWSS